MVVTAAMLNLNTLGTDCRPSGHYPIFEGFCPSETTQEFAN